MLRQAVVLLLVVLVFGIGVPLIKGLAFLQPWVIAAYGGMALLFVAPAAAEFWSANPAPDSARAVLGKLFATVGFGWGVSVLMLATAVVTLNLAYWGGRVLIPPQELFASVLVFSLAASTAVAALCAVLALRMPAVTVKSILRLFFLALLMVLAFGARFLPESWQIALSDHSTRRAITRMAWEGAAVSVVAGAGLVAYLVRSRRATKS